MGVPPRARLGSVGPLGDCHILGGLINEYERAS